jgi:Heparinase II/III-like protein/Heparinase II/III N-terminus
VYFSALYYRLRAMSAVEICSRIGRGLRDRLSFYLGHFGVRKDLEADLVYKLLDSPLTSGPPATEAVKLPETERLIARARAALAGHQSLFGIPVDLGSPVDWLKDPLTGRTAKKNPPPFLGFSHGRADGVDVRSIWELNRLQVLADLGQAYHLRSQPEYPAAMAEIIGSWDRANPYGRTINWANALEVGIRTFSLVQAVLLIRGSEIARDEKFVRALAQLLYLHGRYLCGHLSRGSTAFNHLAGEGAALFVLGACFPGLPGAKKWRARGEKALARSVRRLILPDGGGLEGSLHYLIFICRLVVLTCRLTGDCRFLERYDLRERLTSAYRFLCVATDGGRSISEFGDSDDATVPGSPPEEAALRYRTGLNMLYLFLDDQPLLHSYQPDLESLWLFGPRALNVVTSGLEAPDRLTIERFGYSGRYVIRWPGDGKTASGFLRFECGLWGVARTWTHAHADRLSFSLFLDEKPFFIDPGTGAYLGNLQWREYFRSTHAHNTALVNGKSQGEPLSPFFWKKEVPSRLVRLEETEDEVILVGEHYGYRRDGVLHRRKIRIRPAESCLELVDDFFTEGRQRISLGFNLHPRCIAEIKDNTLGIVSILSGGNSEGERIGLDLNCDERCRISLHKGEESPARGWFSPGFMRREPCSQLVCEAEIEGETSLSTRISWRKD